MINNSYEVVIIVVLLIITIITFINFTSGDREEV